MDIGELKRRYQDLLRPIFGEQLGMDDSEEEQNWIVFFLDGPREEFTLFLYGIDCVRLFWCNECFILDKHRNNLVSSDTYGEIVLEADFEIEQLPELAVSLILQCKDCTYVTKEETIIGKTLFGYDDRRDYLITARAQHPKQDFQLANITIKYIL